MSRLTRPKRTSTKHRRKLEIELLAQRRLLVSEIEPNDSIAAATLISGASITLTGSMRNVADTDFFKINLESGETIQVEYPQPGIGPQFAIVSKLGELYSYSPDFEILRFTAPRSDSYYLRLRAQTTYGDSFGNYNLQINTTAFVGVDEKEPNDATPTPIASAESGFRGNLSNSNDTDRFSFYAIAGQSITLRFADLPARNPAIMLQGPSGNIIDSDATGLGLATLAAQSGTYQVLVGTNNVHGLALGGYYGELRLANSATVDPELGDTFEQATHVDLGPRIVPSQYLSPDSQFQVQGLRGSYINQSLRNTSSTRDWTQTQPIAGTRIDPKIHFAQDGWGARSAVHLTNGTDENWESFSVQWDGYIRVVTPGTRVAIATDDGGRFWIDANQDGLLGDNNGELINNNWGQPQGTTISNFSAPLQPGNYRIRIQYEEEIIENRAYLVWDDIAHSSGNVSRFQTFSAVGELSDLTDIDFYSVDVSANGFTFYSLISNATRLGSEDRTVTLYNEYGQALEWSAIRRIGTDNENLRPEVNGRYYVSVQANVPRGLGPYTIEIGTEWEFPAYRKVPTFFQDYSQYNRQEHIPVFISQFESTYDIFQVDTTFVKPTTEHVAWSFKSGGGGCGGVGGGGYGIFSASGGGQGNCDADWTNLSDIWFGLAIHEMGHGIGLPHTRHPLSMMNYGGQFDYLPIGSFNRIAGDARLPVRKPVNERNHIDWVLQAGRIVVEDESNDTIPMAQQLDAYFKDMSYDTDVRNDKVVVTGSIKHKSDADNYAVHINSGETWWFDIDSAEFQYPLNAKIELLDTAGNSLAVSDDALDRNSGIESVDPFLQFTAHASGTYVVRITGELGTVGAYRLKAYNKAAADKDGPRIYGAWPSGGSQISSTRRIYFWVNDQIDPATLTSNSIQVRGTTSGIRPGMATFDPFTSTLTWQATSPLPVDSYTVTLPSGGLRDLVGNFLDGETDGSLVFPEVSGNGVPGGNFVTRFQVTSSSLQPATVTFVNTVRHEHERTMFVVGLSKEIDISDLYQKSITIRSAGPDRQLDTSDDILFPSDTFYQPRSAIRYPELFVYSRGVLAPNTYRIEANLLDESGLAVRLSHTTNVAVAIPQEFLSVDPGRNQLGLTGSYVNQSLRDRPNQEDWTKTLGITTKSRVDPKIEFYGSLGSRSEVGVTGGTDADWDNFSVQWDGFVTIPVSGTRLFTRSDDGSRLWIDVNGDGAFATTGNEFLNNNWGSAQGVTSSSPSVPLQAGTYRVRLQYEDGILANEVSLQWDLPAAQATAARLYSSPRVIEVSPQPNSTVNYSPDAIKIAFSEPLQLSTVTNSTFRVRYSPNEDFFDNDDQYVSDADGKIRWDAQSNAAVFEPTTGLANGFYMIELNGSTQGITNSAGVRLDGEYRDANIAGYVPLIGWNNAPSGDGYPGGDYRAAFVVSAPALDLTLSNGSVAENAGANAVIGTIRRSNADLSVPLVVNLLSSDTSEVIVASVTIPAGASEATFPVEVVDDSLLDGIQSVVITANASGYQADTKTLDVTDFETISLSAENTAIVENAGVGSGRLKVALSNTDRASNITLSLVSSDLSELKVANTVVIPAGANFVEIPIDAVDDQLLDGTQLATILVSATGYVSDHLNFSVLDAESILLSLDRTWIKENAGSNAAQLTIQRSNTNVNSSVAVSLSTSSFNQISIPSSVVIPSGKNSITIAIGTFENALSEDTRSVLVTAVANGYANGSVALDIVSAPSLDSIADLAVDEDAGLQVTHLSGISSGFLSANETLVKVTSSNAAIISQPLLEYQSPNSTARMIWNPEPNQFGSSVITVSVENGGVDQILGTTADNVSLVRSFTITVRPVNDTPLLDTISNLVIDEDSGNQLTLLTGIAAGGAESQPLRITATSNNSSLIADPFVNFSSPNSIGQLSWRPQQDRFGEATITVTVEDGGLDQSLATSADNAFTHRTFTVTVNPINDAPQIDAVANSLILEDAMPQITLLSGIRSGGGELQPLRITASSSNLALVPDPLVTYTSSNSTGQLQWAPLSNRSGQAIISITVEDGGLDLDLLTLADNGILQSQFTITVSAVNDPPSFLPIANVLVQANSAKQTTEILNIDAGGFENQTLLVAASSSNPGLISNPQVIYSSPDDSAKLIWQPTSGRSGKTNITVTLYDGVDRFSQTFAISVNAAPVVQPDIAEVIGSQLLTISVLENDTDAETSRGSLQIQVVSPPPADQATVSVSGGQILFRAQADYFGVSKFSYRVIDSDGATAEAQVSVGIAKSAKQNPWNTLDVNRDSRVSPSDALAVINFLNDTTQSRIVGSFTSSSDIDVNGDNRISPADALLIINDLNAKSGGEGELTELKLAPILVDALDAFFGDFEAELPKRRRVR